MTNAIRMTKPSEPSSKAQPHQALKILAMTKAVPRLSPTAQHVLDNRKLILQAVRNGHQASAISSALKVPVRTLRVYLREWGVFWRAPRSELSRRRLARFKRKSVRKVGKGANV